MSQIDAYRSLFPKAVLTANYSKLEQHVLANLVNNPAYDQAIKDAVTYGTSIHQSFGPSRKGMWRDWYKTGIEIMPRLLFSFDPAMNNKIIRTSVQTTAELQVALNEHKHLTHISCVSDGKHWLILKGPVSHNSAIKHSKWKPISFKRLPKTLRMLLVIDPLME